MVRRNFAKETSVESTIALHSLVHFRQDPLGGLPWDPHILDLTDMCAARTGPPTRIGTGQHGLAWANTRPD